MERVYNNITDIFIDQALKRPNDIAFEYYGGSVTYKELNSYVWNMSAYLYKNNIKPLDVVALTFKNPFYYIVCALASARIGATIFPLAQNTPKIMKNNMLKSANAKFYLTDTDLELDDKSVIVLKISSILLKKDDLEVDYDIMSQSPNTPWQIIVGSGSTGKTKFIPVTHSQEISRTVISIKSFKIYPSDRVSSMIGFYYSDSLRRFFETVFSGGTFVVIDQKTPINIKKHKVTFLRATVFHIEELLNKLPSNSTNVLDFLRVLSLGTAPVSNNLRERIKKHLTKNVYVTYGTNETGTITVTSLQDVYNVAGTVGKPHYGVTIEVVDKEGNNVSEAQIGEIRIKTSGLSSLYLNDETASKKAFKNGYFYPGDLGKLTKDKKLIHMGRSDHMIIMNGINIYPSEIEQVMLTHRAVKDVAVMPIKSNLHNEIPACAVVLNKSTNINAARLKRYNYERLGSRSARQVIIVDSIPRNEQGKLIREELKKIIDKKTLRKIAQNIDPKNLFYLSFTKNDLPLDTKLIDQWFSNVLKIDIMESKSDKNLVYNVSHRILALACTLFQAVRLPMFEPGKIVQIKYSVRDKKYIIVVGLQTIDDIEVSIYSTILKQCVKIVLNDLKNPISKQNIQIFYNHLNNSILKRFRRTIKAGKSIIPILKEAYNLNIPFLHLGAGVYQLGIGSKARVIYRSATQFDAAFGAKLAQNKILTTNILHNAGLPAPKNIVVKSKNEALLAVNKLGWNVVVKPADLDRGEGVTVGIDNEEKLYKAIEYAKKVSRTKKIIVEREAKGVCCRLFIANGKLLYCVKRLPKSVVGDGKSSVKELINDANEKEKSLPPWLKSEYFPMDALAMESIKKGGFSLDSIPEIQQLVPLRDIESTKWGGYDVELTNYVHPENIDIALRAAKIFGLNVAGVDIITEDISKPWYENKAIINEVNFSPLFGGGEVSKKAIPVFLNDYLEDKGRIPISVMIGKDRALVEAKKIQKKRFSNNINCFIITELDTYKSNGEILHLSFNCVVKSIKSLFINSNVDEIIVVSSDKTLLSNNLIAKLIKSVIYLND